MAHSEHRVTGALHATLQQRNLRSMDCGSRSHALLLCVAVPDHRGHDTSGIVLRLHDEGRNDLHSADNFDSPLLQMSQQAGARSASLLTY
jgi:hypothetical protein